MGRYFIGDIEGKFWFGVQPSNDADFFGVDGCGPSILQYYFDTSNLEEINKGIETCRDELGKFKEKIKDFFNSHNGYNDKELSDYLKVSKEKVRELLEWYARLELGLKIRDCVNDGGTCEFEAEC